MDAHCHLSDEAFDKDRPGIYQELLAHDIHGLVLAGTEPKDWVRQKALELPDSLRVARVFGIHPWWVDEFSDDQLQDALHTLANSHWDCEGFGELGLDYFRAKTEAARQKQRRWFEAQLKLSAPFDLPLVLHIVKGHHEALPILRKQRQRFRGLVHAFWANKETAEAYIKLGFLLSIPPRILKEDPHRILSELDPEFLVFETDTPFTDAENNCVRPVFIHEMLEFVAKSRGEDVQRTVSRQERLLTDLFPVLKGEPA